MACCAAAQNSSGVPAQVQRLEVLREGTDVRVEVTLSTPAQPSVETAVHPDRLVLILPNTSTDARQQRAEANVGGVSDVRMGLHSANPPVTHVVVDLDQVHPYELESQGTKVILKIHPATANQKARNGTPVPAAKSPLVSIFQPKRRHSQPAPADDHAELQSIPVPPPAFPPINFPANQGSSSNSGANSSTAASSVPTAAQPNRGSLQQGTVFPETGTPGTGNVPGVNTGNSGADQTATQNPAQPAAAVVANSSPTISQPQPAPTDNGPSAASNGTISSAGVSEPVASAPTSSISVAAPSTHDQQPVSPPERMAAPDAPPNAAGPVPQSRPSPLDSDSSSAGQPAATTTAEVESSIAQPVPSQPMVRAANPDLRTAFKVKYVAEGSAYLDGGRSSGLAEGMKLIVRESTTSPTSPSPGTADPGRVAELEVVSVAENSAVTDIHQPTARDVKAGDLAYLSAEDEEALVQKNALSATRKYPTVISFTEGDTLDEEVRAEIPKPPMPSVNRVRGRFGFDYMGTVMHGSPSLTTSDIGGVVRTDMTRIGGTYWNMSGYWRGRLHTSSGNQVQTLQDLINRTYHLALTYDNPQSAWVAGFGRMYLPWASSLDTIDGGYFGRRIHPGATLGVFAGSTPDPTSWDYNPDQRIGGAFINFEGGSYDNFRYSSTTGMGVSTIKWNIDRPFVFLENSIFYKRYLSIYSSLQADSPSGNQAVTAPGAGIGRSYLTVRVQPTERLELDFNHTYFRDVPTFDPTLIGTGLLDKYLFQGFSVGARVEVVKQIWVYSTIGQSNRSGDAQNSLNQAYGITFGHVPKLGLRADAHYSRFSSSFGNGSYQALSLSRTIGDSFRLELLAGQQNFSSSFTANNRSRFVTGNVEVPMGMHYFLQGGYTVSRGASMSYDQWMFTLGYRFDSRSNKRK